MKRMIKEISNDRLLFVGMISFLIICSFVISLNFQKYAIGKRSGMIAVLGVQTQVLGNENTKDIDFYYDAGGQRAAKIEENGDHVYYISPTLEIIVKPDGTTRWRKNYYFAGKVVAVREGP